MDKPTSCTAIVVSPICVLSELGSKVNLLFGSYGQVLLYYHPLVDWPIATAMLWDTIRVLYADVNTDVSSYRLRFMSLSWIVVSFRLRHLWIPPNSYVLSASHCVTNLLRKHCKQIAFPLSLAAYFPWLHVRTIISLSLPLDLLNNISNEITNAHLFVCYQTTP